MQCYLSASCSFTQSAVVNLGFISRCGISYEHCHVLLRLDTLSRTSDLTHVVFSNCTRLSQTLLTSLIAFCWQRDDETKRWGAFQYSGKFVLILEAKICPRIMMKAAAPSSLQLLPHIKMRQSRNYAMYNAFFQTIHIIRGYDAGPCIQWTQKWRSEWCWWWRSKMFLRRKGMLEVRLTMLICMSFSCDLIEDWVACFENSPNYTVFTIFLVKSIKTNVWQTYCDIHWHKRAVFVPFETQSSL